MIKRFDIAEVGCSVDGRIMENGERRLRMRLPNGSIYIYTDQSVGAWQNAHHHKGLCETYIIQKGWVVFAEHLDAHGYRTHMYRTGDIFTSMPDIDHNVYVSNGSVFHTVQYGTSVGNPERDGKDWYFAGDEFDEWTKSLSLADIEKIAEK